MHQFLELEEDDNIRRALYGYHFTYFSHHEENRNVKQELSRNVQTEVISWYLRLSLAIACSNADDYAQCIAIDANFLTLFDPSLELWSGQIKIFFWILCYLYIFSIPFFCTMVPNIKLNLKLIAVFWNGFKNSTYTFLCTWFTWDCLGPVFISHSNITVNVQVIKIIQYLSYFWFLKFIYCIKIFKKDLIPRWFPRILIIVKICRYWLVEWPMLVEIF